MTILGIDPGTARMGYAVVKHARGKIPQILEADTFVTHPNLEMPNRLKFLYNELKKIVSKHKPDVMVIERLFFNTNAKTAISVGQARGIAMLAAASPGLLLVEYTALEAKKAVSGSGKADKKEMQTAVKEVLGLDVILKSDDANDAVALALCYLVKEVVKPKDAKKN